MGDPRRPAWLCSPTPRPWGFRGNFRAQQQHQHQTCFVVSWMSGWGMNHWIHKTTWDKKKKSRNCSFSVLIDLFIPAYRYFFPSLYFSALMGLGMLPQMPPLSGANRHRLGIKVWVRGFPPLFCVSRKYVSTYEPWGFYTKYWIHVNMMKQTMWFRTEAF